MKLDPVAERLIAAIEKEEPPKLPEPFKVVNSHISFFESIMPSVENFSEGETLSILELIRDMKFQRNNLHYSSATSFPSYSGVSTPISTRFHPHFMNIPNQEHTPILITTIWKNEFDITKVP